MDNLITDLKKNSDFYVINNNVILSKINTKPIENYFENDIDTIVNNNGWTLNILQTNNNVQLWIDDDKKINTTKKIVYIMFTYNGKELYLTINEKEKENIDIIKIKNINVFYEMIIWQYKKGIININNIKDIKNFEKNYKFIYLLTIFALWICIYKDNKKYLKYYNDILNRRMLKKYNNSEKMGV